MAPRRIFRRIMAKTPENPESSPKRAWSPPAAIPKPSTASSIRRSITPRPCSIRPPRTRSRTARAINTAAAARRPRRRWRTRCASSKAQAAPAWRCCPPDWRRSRPRCCRSLRAGDHILVTDSVYRPTRNFCDGVFKRMGVETTYYDPLIGAGIAAADSSRTRARCSSRRPARRASRCRTFRPSPRSRTHKGALVLMDNTWATPLYFRAVRQGRRSLDPGRHQIYRRPFRRHVRHASRPTQRRCRSSRTPCTRMGLCVGPDDMYLALRGLRTLGVRLRAASSIRACRSRAGSSSGRKSCACCIRRCESDPGHAHLEARLHRRLRPVQHRAQAGMPSRPCYAFINALTLFGMGSSWGGFESLVIPFDCARVPHRDADGRRAARRCASTSGWKISAT